MKTRILGSFLGLGALSLLAAPQIVGVASAQETLAGLGAASGIGATLGAAAAGSAMNTSRVPRGAGQANELIDEAGNAGGATATTTQTTVAVAVTPISAAPPAQLYGLKPQKVVAQLRKTPTLGAPKGGLPRRRESKVARQRRLARLSPAARKREVQKAYKIPPRGWLASYLPQDRYKFGKDWKYVSTEDSKYYFKPQALALMRFNPNRVIGFNSWQDAMRAGYKPDPLTKPEPAPTVLKLGQLTRGENYYTFVGYVYAGQVNPATLSATYNYSQSVANLLSKHRDAKKQVATTLDAILGAAITGDRTAIPYAVGKTVIMRTTTTTTGAPDANGAPQFPNPNMPNAGQGGTPIAPDAGGPSGSPDGRMDNFNQFSNNAGNLANVPANR